MFLIKRELDDAVDMSRDSPTRLIRNLFGTSFPKEVLSRSSALGRRLHPALDKHIVSACLRKFCFHVSMLKFLLGYIQPKHSTVSHTIFIDAINNKCANARRKQAEPKKK